ncbi:hypothetical protein ACRJ4W_38970 [Streptomyces sp. GLT-R25]
MPSPAPTPGSPPPPAGTPPRTPWWRTGWARVGFVLAVPALGVHNAFLGFLMLVLALVLLWWGNVWRKRWKATATVAAVILFGAILPPAPRDRTSDTVAEADEKARIAGGPDGSSTPAPGTNPKVAPKVPDYRDMRLDRARREGRGRRVHRRRPQRVRPGRRHLDALQLDRLLPAGRHVVEQRKDDRLRSSADRRSVSRA